MRADLIMDWMAKQGYPPLTGEQLALLARYQERLLAVNQYMNLTAITSDEDFAVKHFIDSLSLLPWLPPAAAGMRALDIGAGAGFPGLVLKIVRPEWPWVLMDSLRKRILFLRETADMLGLSGVECIHARAEELARKPEHKNQYDIVTARAVARLDKLAGYALPFVKKGGLFLAMKGPDAEAEIKEAQPAFKKYGCACKEVKNVQISSEIRHTVIVINKQR